MAIERSLETGDSGVRADIDELRSSPVRRVERGRGWARVVLQGELDLYNAGLLADVLEHECRLGPDRLVVDLRDVALVDSTAIHTLVAVRKLLPNWRGLVLLASPSGHVRRTLDIVGVARVVSVHDASE